MTLVWVIVVVTARVMLTVSIVVCVTVVGFWTATVVYNVEDVVAVTTIILVLVVFTVSIVVCVTVVGFWTATVVYNVENFVAGTTLILVFVVSTMCVLKAFRVCTVGIVFVDVAVPQEVRWFVVDLISKTIDRIVLTVVE